MYTWYYHTAPGVYVILASYDTSVYLYISRYTHPQPNFLHSADVTLYFIARTDLIYSIPCRKFPCSLCLDLSTTHRSKDCRRAKPPAPLARVFQVLRAVGSCAACILGFI